MSDVLLRLYHRLPGPARSVAASLRGLYLRQWRYGPETERLVAEALERECWSSSRWEAYQSKRLSYVLHRAATQVPYYRLQWAARRRRGDRSSWEYLENWPILEKEALRSSPRSFIADDCDVRKMFHEHTSGTTGTPLDLWWSRQTVRAWYALFEARCRLWNDVSRYDRWAILGGQLVTPVEQRRPPFWVWNAPQNQLYLSSFHLAPDLIRYYLEALRRYGIKYLLGYTSSLNALAHEALREGQQGAKMQVALANAEPVFDCQRTSIAEAFQCPLRETYGMAEIVAAATECQHGRMHLWPEVGLVELFDSEQPVGDRPDGDLVCTGLLNADMPLIRYRVGDRGTAPTERAICRCGRTLPTAPQLQGRVNDMLLTKDGRRVYWMDPTFYGVPVREAQIIQEALGRVRVRYVPAREFSAKSARCIAERVRKRIGDVEVILEPVDRVPRAANGKFRAVVCSPSLEEGRSVDSAIRSVASTLQ